jgi:hypothetical protein
VHVLLETSAGRILLCVGVLLDALGVMWTARLISSAERPGAMLAQPAALTHPNSPAPRTEAGQ